MAYSFQTFSVNQIFTSSQANQIEVNVRDHAHGGAGVNQTVGAAPTASGHYVNRGYADQFIKGQVVNGLRAIVGRVLTNTTGIVAGSGFAVASLITTGRVLITFTTSFTQLPWVMAVANADIGGPFYDEAAVASITNGSFALNRHHWGGGSITQRDGGAEFIAIGIV